MRIGEGRWRWAAAYGGSRGADRSHQMAAATRADAEIQFELMRQQDEIIRLLEAVGRRDGSVR